MNLRVERLGSEEHFFACVCGGAGFTPFICEKTQFG